MFIFYYFGGGIMTTISGQGSINWNPLQPATAGAAEQLSNTGIIKAPVVQSDGTKILKDFVVTIQAGSRAELQKIMDEINPVAIGTLITHEWADDTRKDLGYTTTRLELTNLSTLQSGVDKPKLLHTYKPKGNSQEKTLDRTTPLDNIVSNLFNQTFSGISQHPSQQTVQAPEPRAQQLPRSGTVMTIEALRTPLAHPTLAAHTTAPPPYPTHLAQPSSSGQTGATAHAAHSSTAASQSQRIEQHLTELYQQKQSIGDHKEAFDILQKAEPGNLLSPKLKLALALYYLNGEKGVAKDLMKAKNILKELKNVEKYETMATEFLEQIEQEEDKKLASYHSHQAPAHTHSAPVSAQSHTTTAVHTPTPAQSASKHMTSAPQALSSTATNPLDKAIEDVMQNAANWHQIINQELSKQLTPSDVAMWLMTQANIENKSVEVLIAELNVNTEVYGASINQLIIPLYEEYLRNDSSSVFNVVDPEPEQLAQAAEPFSDLRARTVAAFESEQGSSDGPSSAPSAAQPDQSVTQARTDDEVDAEPPTQKQGSSTAAAPAKDAPEHKGKDREEDDPG